VKNEVDFRRHSYLGMPFFVGWDLAVTVVAVPLGIAPLFICV